MAGRGRRAVHYSRRSGFMHVTRWVPMSSGRLKRVAEGGDRVGPEGTGAAGVRWLLWQPSVGGPEEPAGG